MKLKRTWMAVLTICGLSAVLPAAASARPVFTPTPAAECPAPELFAALGGFGDPRSYFVAPGGAFEAPSWQLTGGAALTGGSGPLHLGSAKGALMLPPGGSATSPVFCVDLDYPTMRFFSAQLAAKSSSKLHVDVIYPARGTSNPEAMNVSNGTPAWQLSKDVRLRPDQVDHAGGWRQVQLRFSADKATAGDWRVDDVVIDPRMRG
jgi:hypothetical protein